MSNNIKKHSIIYKMFENGYITEHNLEVLNNYFNIKSKYYKTQLDKILDAWNSITTQFDNDFDLFKYIINNVGLPATLNIDKDKYTIKFENGPEIIFDEGLNQLQNKNKIIILNILNN